MTQASVETIAPPQDSAQSKRPLGALLVSLVLFALGLFAVVQAATMEVVGDSIPGPDFFPMVVGILLLLTAILLAINWFRSKTKDHSADSQAAMDWASLSGAAGSFIAFIFILEPLGWLIAATGLFWLVSLSLGGTKHLMNLAIAALFSAITQIVFSLGLGISLPSGILGGLF